MRVDGGSSSVDAGQVCVVERPYVVRMDVEPPCSRAGVISLAFSAGALVVGPWVFEGGHGGWWWRGWARGGAAVAEGGVHFDGRGWNG